MILITFIDENYLTCMDSIFVIQLRLWSYVPSIIGLEMIITDVSPKTFKILSL